MWKLAFVDYPKEFWFLLEQALRMREQLQEAYENKDAIIAEGTAAISEVQQMVCGFAFSTCVCGRMGRCYMLCGGKRVPKRISWNSSFRDLRIAAICFLKFDQIARDLTA
jgi:hypothetical protein